MNTPCTLRLVDGKKMLVFSLPCINENVVLYIQEIPKGVEKQWVLIGNLKLWEFLCDDVLDLV